MHSRNRKPVILIQEPDDYTRGLYQDYYLRSDELEIKTVSSRREALDCCQNEWHPIAVFFYERRPPLEALDQDPFTCDEVPYARIINCPLEGGFIAAERKSYERELEKRKIRLVDWSDGLDCLDIEIRSCLENYAPLTNSALQFIPAKSQPVTFEEIISWIEPGIEEYLFFSRCSELQDFLRLRYPACDAIELRRILWHQGGRVAVVVNSYPCMLDQVYQSKDEHLLLVGKWDELEKSDLAYDNYAPRNPDESISHKRGTHQRLTTHFAGSIFDLGGDADLNTVTTITGLYQAGQTNLVVRVIEYLFTHSLEKWLRDKTGKNTPDVSQIFRHLMGIPSADDLIEQVRAGISALLDKWAVWGVDVQQEKTKFILRLSGGEKREFENPFVTLPALMRYTEPSSLAPSPGSLCADTVITDWRGRGWITDYFRANLAPPQWACATLEADIRYAWPRSVDFAGLLRFEEVLADFPSSFSEEDSPQSYPALLNIIRALRQYARVQVPGISHTYLLALLHLAMQRLAAFSQPAAVLTDDNAASGFQALVTLLITSQHLAKQLESFISPSQPDLRLSMLTRENGLQPIFICGGDEVNLSETENTILVKLYETQTVEGALNITSYRSLHECTSKEEYKAYLHKERLHQQMSRLKKALGEEDNRLIYIESIRNEGYRLHNPPLLRSTASSDHPEL